MFIAKPYILRKGGVKLGRFDTPKLAIDHLRDNPELSGVFTVVRTCLDGEHVIKRVRVAA